MDSLCVDPLSSAAITTITEHFRKTFNLGDPYLPVAAILEVALARHFGSHYEFTVKEKFEMGSKHGCFNPVTGELSLRLDVYEGVCAGNARDRFTACHEIGHLILHRSVTLNRVASGTKVPAYRNPEWQANEFAAQLMMPHRLVRSRTSLTEIMEDFGVSLSAAEVRADKLKLLLPRNKV